MGDQTKLAKRSNVSEIMMEGIPRLEIDLKV